MHYMNDDDCIITMYIKEWILYKKNKCLFEDVQVI